MQSASEPRASFIVCTRNRADFFRKVLANIREFIQPGDELHIIDGCSTDETPRIAAENADIITSFESLRSGISHAYNIGFLKARGRYIVNLTDDDYFFADGINTAIETMEAHPEIDALVCGGVYSRYDETTGKIVDWGYQYLPPGKPLADDVKHLFINTVAGFMLLNRRVVARVGLLDTSIQASDTDYMSRLLLCGMDFRYLNVKTVRHIEYKHSSQLNWRASRLDWIRILVRHGEWSYLLNFTWDEIETALGLLDGADSSAFKKLCRNALRTVYYAANNAAFRVLEHTVRLRGDPRALAAKVRNRVGGGAAAAPEASLSEPVWDGSLR